ncbi:MAG: hypothetical protein A3H98_01555 [Bacteroidetes bacterium RIFCSPLOWO2_02_FULL_36_8]|nr:MAG: hypothetical protein A3H98_01555 [Bacteroidetes bacterium RIFCSPLOWO2_02_FULL_36_8]OFY69346.1 MAG: hypothetical protein A3G23_00900 [Bacteroidetes bacterium RIFCSPLOWO2_12_FULL_37_12]
MSLLAICNMPAAPLRTDSSDKAEMSSQLLLGDLVEIKEENAGWSKIVVCEDNYEGWVDKKQILALSTKELRYYKPDLTQGTETFSTEIFSWATGDNEKLPVFFGSRLPDFKKGKFILGKKRFQFSGEVVQTKNISKTEIVNFALRLLNCPYLWGGKTPAGYDCSGFVQLLFRMAGIRLGRDAYQQISFGNEISGTENSEPGDLAFFKNDAGRINHVGMIFEKGRIIHSSGKVRIDSIDNKGILNEEYQEYSHLLFKIKGSR